jgi:hypothetical protein
MKYVDEIYVNEILERVRKNLPRKCKACWHEDTLVAHKGFDGDYWHIIVSCVNCREEISKKVDNIKTGK